MSGCLAWGKALDPTVEATAGSPLQSDPLLLHHTTPSSLPPYPENWSPVLLELWRPCRPCTSAPSSLGIVNVLYGLFATFLAGGSHVSLAIRPSGSGP